MRACRQDLALQDAVITVFTYSHKIQVDCGRGNWSLQLEYFSDQDKFTYHNVSSLQYVLSHFSHVWLFVSLQTVACQAPLFIGFPRQEYWSGLPSPSPGDLPNPGIEPTSPGLAEFFTTEPPGKPILSAMGLLSTAVENSLAVPQKVKYRVVLWTNNSSFRSIWKKKKIESRNSNTLGHPHS